MLIIFYTNSSDINVVIMCIWGIVTRTIPSSRIKLINRLRGSYYELCLYNIYNAVVYVHDASLINYTSDINLLCICVTRDGVLLNFYLVTVIVVYNAADRDDSERLMNMTKLAILLAIYQHGNLVIYFKKRRYERFICWYGMFLLWSISIPVNRATWL